MNSSQRNHIREQHTVNGIQPPTFHTSPLSRLIDNTNHPRPVQRWL